jgi:hypothetical protein
VDTTTPVRLVDEKVFGLNTAVWNGAFPDAQTVADLQEMKVRFLRYPGGSSSDAFHWQTNVDNSGNSAGPNNFDTFAPAALAAGAQVVITANYGTGTVQEAADWVTYSNVTKGYGFKYWEVGNECYGTWEDDTQSSPHDPYTYATRAVQYIKAMKAVDPTIRVGVVAVTGEDANSNGYTSHPATNPRTNAAHNGWTPVMLATMKAAGTLPDYLIYHRYDGSPGSESDATLLQAALTWPNDAAALRQMLTDYLGASGAAVQLLVTENNSVYTGPGKQSVSVVNGLYMADSIANVMQTEFNSLIWWDMYNGPGTTYNNGTTNVSVNLSSSLYGWRMYGDYGVENGGAGSLDPTAHDRYPTFYIMKLMSDFARQGDTVVTATSNNPQLSAYAVHRLDDSLTVLAINKSSFATYNANFSIKGYTPQANAKVYSYGIPQDEYSEENAQSVNSSSVNSSWENSLDGWVNQSGPDVAANNYGQTGPFTYTLGYSNSAGVTNGSTSLSCSTTQSGLGDHAVIINTTAAMGTALSTASSVSFDIYPQTSGGPVAVSIYLNGTNLSYTELTPVNLNLNQENSVSFPITSAQRAAIVSSIASGDYMQIGINVNCSSPTTVYLDNFQVQSAATPTPTPTPTPIAGAASSPDVAVSSISNAGATFTASFAPYSATVISLTKPSLSPAFASQPVSQTVASGSTVVFSAPATGTPAPTYQWYLNGTAVPSGNGPTLVVSGATSADAGNYTCTVTNPSGSLTSSAAALSVVNTSDPGRLINLSCRAQVGTGGNILISGFAVGPIGAAGTESLLIRGSGPALAAFDVAGTLPDPKLQLYNGGSALLDSNFGWNGSTAISSAAAAVGAFGWSSKTSLDSALVEALPAGPYSAEILGSSGDTGVALAEVYDATPAGTYTLAAPRLVNLSTRVQVGTGGGILIAGFVIGGSTSETVLIRASGPALAAFGVPGTLPDPKLTLYSGSTVLASNNGWGGNSQIVSAASAVGAFAWGNPSSNDSAILITLPPGNYTAQIAGASGDTGVALVEVYEVR